MRFPRPNLNAALLSPETFLAPLPKTSHDLTSLFIPVCNRIDQKRGELCFGPGSGQTANCRGNSCSEASYNPALCDPWLGHQWLSKPSPKECKECEKFCLGVLIYWTEFKNNFLYAPFEMEKKRGGLQTSILYREIISPMLPPFETSEDPGPHPISVLSYCKATLSMTLLLFIIILPLSTASINSICF